MAGYRIFSTAHALPVTLFSGVLTGMCRLADRIEGVRAIRTRDTGDSGYHYLRVSHREKGVK